MQIEKLNILQWVKDIVYRINRCPLSDPQKNWKCCFSVFNYFKLAKLFSTSNVHAYLLEKWKALRVSVCVYLCVCVCVCVNKVYDTSKVFPIFSKSSREKEEEEGDCVDYLPENKIQKFKNVVHTYKICTILKSTSKSYIKLLSQAVKISLPQVKFHLVENVKNSIFHYGNVKNNRKCPTLTSYTL